MTNDREPQKRQANALFGLLILGGLAMAARAFVGHINNIHHSLRQSLMRWINQHRVQVTQDASKFMSSDEGREIMPHITPKNQEDER